MPFTAEELCVEGHAIQGEGCSPRNLQALNGAMLRPDRIDFVMDYPIQALKHYATPTETPLLGLRITQ